MLQHKISLSYSDCLVSSVMWFWQASHIFMLFLLHVKENHWKICDFVEKILNRICIYSIDFFCACKRILVLNSWLLMSHTHTQFELEIHQGYYFRFWKKVQCFSRMISFYYEVSLQFLFLGECKPPETSQRLQYATRVTLTYIMQWASSHRTRP